MSDHRPFTTAAKAAGYPDPPDNPISCPYCIDAREQIGVNLPGCLVHFPREGDDR